MKHNLNVNPARFAQLAERVWNVDPEGKTQEEVALEGIEKLREFWSSIGAPSRLADYDIDDSKLDLIADKAMANGEFGNFNNHQLNKRTRSASCAHPYKTHGRSDIGPAILRNTMIV